MPLKKQKKSLQICNFWRSYSALEQLTRCQIFERTENEFDFEYLSTLF